MTKRNTKLTVEEQQALRLQFEAEVLKKVLDTYEGRRILYNVIALGDIYDQDGDMSFDASRVQRQLGRRELALQILKDILTSDPGIYIVMQEEAGTFEEDFKIELGSEENG